jgi:hypothetical protein
MTAAYRSNGGAVSRTLDPTSSLLLPALPGIDSACPPRGRLFSGLRPATDAAPDAFIKIFSMACVLWMLPVMAAMVQAMNFKHKLKPEWALGHRTSVLPMIASAVIPFTLFRWKAWL